MEANEVNITGYLGSLDTIAGRMVRLDAGEVPETYTQRLLADQNKRIQKLGSETVEIVREECRPDFSEERFVGEAADVMYALEVMVTARGLSFGAVLNELARRNEK